MEQGEELGSTFVAAVEELGFSGLWSSIKDILESRLPVRQLHLSNKAQKSVVVDKLPLQYVLSTDKRLQRLKPYSKSPVTWFRNPYAHLILVSTADINDYRSTFRQAIKKVTTDIERDWSGPDAEWLILYVRPFEQDINDRACKRVFEMIKDNFSSKKRERCVRLDLPHKVYDAHGRKLAPIGLEEYDEALKECVKASFDTRQFAYHAEVDKLMRERHDPTWSFTTLYLVEDSFALMLEYAGLHEDAYKEYRELERAYLEALEIWCTATVPLNALSDFGADRDGDDTAMLLRANWRDTRRLVLKNNTIPEFRFRQYMFAAQARVMLKLGRPLEVAERGLAFVQDFCEKISEREEQGKARPLLRETWGFSACLALITTTRHFISRGDQLQADWDAELHLPPTPDWSGMAAAGQGSAGGGTPTKKMGHRMSMPPMPAGGDDGKSNLGRPARPRAVSSAADVQPGGLGGQKSGAAVSWDLGLKVDPDELKQLDMGVLAGQATLPTTVATLRSDPEHRNRDAQDRSFHCLLGHLYSLALSELLRMAVRTGLQAPIATAGADDGPLCSAAWRELSGTDGQLLCGFFGLVGRPHLDRAVAPPRPEQPAPKELHPPPTPASTPGRASVAATTTSSLTTFVANSLASGTFGVGSSSSGSISSNSVPTQRASVQDSLVSWMKRPTSPLVTANRRNSDLEGAAADAGKSVRNSAISALDLASMKLFGGRGMHNRTQSAAGVNMNEIAKSLENAGSADAALLRHNSSVPKDIGATTQDTSKPPPKPPPLPVKQVAGAPLQPVPRPVRRLPDPGSVQALPTWLSDWRLKTALGGAEEFEELVIELAGVAGWCYNKAGRLRNASMLYLDVATVMVQRDRVEAACHLLERQQAILSAEGWWALLGALLPHVVACQRLLGHVMLPYTMMHLLALPPGRVPAKDRLQLLHQLQEYASSARQDHAAAIQLSTQQALQVAPLASSYSRFYGRSDSKGRALLVPVACPRGASSLADTSPDQDLPGACLMCVGDTAVVTVDVHSQLPEPVDVTTVTLVLTQLVLAPNFRVNSTAAISFSGRTSISSMSAISGYSAGPASTTPHLASSPLPSSTPGASAANVLQPATPLPNGYSHTEMVMKWQESEELQCGRLLEVRRRSSEGTTTSSVMRPDGSITLAPGCTQLVFEVAPLWEGLYTLKHVTAQLGGCSLLMGVVPRQLLRAPDVAAALARHVPSGPSGGPPQLTISNLGQMTTAGGVHEEVVMLQVEAPLQRLAVAAVGPGGFLVSGHCQWLAVFVRPLHDTLTRARLHIAARQPQQQPPPGRSLDTSQGPCRIDFPHGQRACLQPIDSCEEAAAANHGSEAPPRPATLPTSTSRGMRKAVSSGELLNVDLDSQSLPPDQPTPPPGASSTALVTPRREGSVEPLSGQETPEPSTAEGVQEAADKLREAMELEERDASQTCSSQTSTSGCSASWGGAWVPVSRGTIELSHHLRAACLAEPLLVWVQLMASSPSRPPEVVRVQRQEQQQQPPPRAPGAPSSSSHTRPGSLMVPNSSGTSGTSGPLSPGAEDKKTAPLAAELDVNLEYHSGCWRTHHSMLRLPLLLPFQVACTAHALPTGQVALHVTATYLVPYPARVLSLSLTPQYGVEVGDCLGEELLPVYVQPGGQLGCTFLLKREQEGFSIAQFDEDNASVVNISYSIDPAAPCHSRSLEMATSHSTAPAWERPLPPPPDTIPPPDAAPSTNLQQRRSESDTLESFVSASSTTTLIAEAPSTIPSPSLTPPGRSPRATDIAAAGHAGQSPRPHAGTHTHSHRLLLEFPDSARAENVVRVALLGPASAHIGQMVPLSWQVTRIQSPPASHSHTRAAIAGSIAADAGGPDADEAVYFEVLDAGGESKNWRLHQAKGSLRLGRARGSLSTLEVMATPLSLGSTPAPRLLLRGVTDDGVRAGLDAVHVLN